MAKKRVVEVHGGWAALPGAVARDVSIAVEGDRIIGVGKRKGMRKAHSFHDSIGSEDSIICPSFVDAHMHSPQIATRGLTSDKGLLDWLKSYIWKWEGRMGRKQARACADLSYLEMMRSGVTSFVDFTSVRHTEEAFRAAEALGLRGTIGKTMMDRASPAHLLEDTDESLKETGRLIRRWDGKADGRLRYSITARFGITCSDDLLRGCKELMDRQGVIFTTHCAESEGEIAADRKRYGGSAIRHYHELGLLGKKTLLVHGVWLSEAEIKLTRGSGTAIAHCPGSNMMLGSGVAPVPRMLDAGIRVGLGSDIGAYYNLSMFDQMRLSVLMQKVAKLDPLAIDHRKAFHMATRGGAEAIGLESGELREGMKADITLISGKDIRLAPHNDTIAQIVYCAGPSSVESVMCDGKVLMRDKEVVVADEDRLLSRARAALGSG